MLVSNCFNSNSNGKFDYFSLLTPSESKEPEIERMEKITLSALNKNENLTDEDFENMAEEFMVSELAQYYLSNSHLSVAPSDKLPSGKFTKETIQASSSIAFNFACKWFANNTLKQHLDSKFDECEELNAKARNLKDSLKQTFREISEQYMKKAEAQALLAERETQTRKSHQDQLTNGFNNIFNEEDLAADEINTMFKTYLSDGSLTVEKDHNGRSFFRINSMKSVIQYLLNNPTTTICDFRHFEAEINDIPTLAQYLKDSHQVGDIAFMNTISEDDRKTLAEAVEARNSTSFPLDIQYLEE